MQDLIVAQSHASWCSFPSLPFSIKFSFVKVTGVGSHMQSTYHSPWHTAATQGLLPHLAEEYDGECEVKEVSHEEGEGSRKQEK